MADITGTINNDVLLNGTQKSDTITGLEGNDFMSGASGDDILFGGVGDDAIDGGLGNDALVGGDGNDFLNGSKGKDVLYGDLGINYLTGGENSDSFVIASSLPGSLAVITDFGLGEHDTVTIQQTRFGIATLDQFSFQANSLFYDPVPTDAIQGVQIAYIPPNTGANFDLATDLTLGV